MLINKDAELTTMLIMIGIYVYFHFRKLNINKWTNGQMAASLLMTDAGNETYFTI